MFGGQSKKRQTANLSDVGEIYPMKMSELTSVQETDVLNPSAEPVAHRKNKAAADRWDSEGGQAAADPAYHYDNERLLWRDSQYVKYFKMKKDGIKENVILHKMKLDGADPAMLKKGPKGKSPNTIRRCYWSREGLLRYQWIPQVHAPMTELRAVIYYDSDIVAPKEQLFILDKTWLDMWLMFAVKSTKLPTRIPNLRLVNPVSRKAKKKAEYDVHWRFVNHRVWRYLYDKYGGGPALSVTYEGKEEMRGKGNIRKWAGELNFKKACTVHEEDEDGLDEQYEGEAVLSDDELATKIEELREEEHKRIQDEVASREAARQGRTAGWDPFERGILGMPPLPPELTQEEKDQSMALGIEPLTVHDTPTNRSIAQAKQDEAARLPPKSLVRKIILIEDVGIAIVMRFHKVSKSEALRGMNSQHTVEVFGGPGAPRQTRNFLLRRVKPSGYNKGVGFRVLEGDDIPKRIQDEVALDSEKADEQDSSFTVESNHGSVESIADGEEDDKLLPEKSNDADDGGASRKKRSLGSFSATRTKSGSTIAEEPEAEAAAEATAAAAATEDTPQPLPVREDKPPPLPVREDKPPPLPVKEDEPPPKTQDEASEAAAADGPAAVEEEEAATPMGLQMSRPSWLATMAESHESIKESFSNLFASPGIEGTIPSDRSSKDSAGGGSVYKAINPNDSAEDQASDMPPETLVGKTIDVTGVGIGKVLSFNKVDNMKRIQGKHSVHTIEFDGAPRDYLLRRRKNGKFNTGLRFKVVPDSISEEQ